MVCLMLLFLENEDDSAGDYEAILQHEQQTPWVDHEPRDEIMGYILDSEEEGLDAKHSGSDGSSNTPAAARRSSSGLAGSSAGELIDETTP